MPRIILRQMHRTETAAPNLLLDDILIDAMDRGTVIIIAAAILRLGVQRLFHAFRLRRCSSMMSDRALVRGSGSSTCESQFLRCYHMSRGELTDA